MQVSPSGTDLLQEDESVTDDMGGLYPRFERTPVGFFKDWLLDDQESRLWSGNGQATLWYARQGRPETTIWTASSMDAVITPERVLLRALSIQRAGGSRTIGGGGIGQFRFQWVTGCDIEPGGFMKPSRATLTAAFADGTLVKLRIAVKKDQRAALDLLAGAIRDVGARSEAGAAVPIGGALPAASRPQPRGRYQ